MISPQELRREARRRKLALDLIEKDYVLGWLLNAIYSSSVSSLISFKGGTDLSKVFFHGNWRLSEDLDFTSTSSADPETLIRRMASEIPSVLLDISGIDASLRDKPHSNKDYAQVRFHYVGPISKNSVKVDVSRETFIGPTAAKNVPHAYDYTEFSILSYTIDNILGEKMRTILERGKLRDYYDVWKLLKTNEFKAEYIRDLFLKKCEGKGVEYNLIEQFFPSGLIDALKPHLKDGLTRLTSEELPELEDMVDELRRGLEKILL